MLSEEDIGGIIDLRQHYRNTFSAPSGKIVLRHMLYELCFFNDDIKADDHEGRERRNYANTLIERLGCADNPDLTAEAFINAILALPIKTNG